jgi:ABC-type sugar transport system permease subunit
MATTATASRLGAQTEERQLLAGRRRAQLTEALLGLLFVAPVALIAFIFKVFPVVYGLFLSVQGGVNIPEGFVGLDNFVDAIGSLAYMLSLAIALIFGITGGILYNRATTTMSEGKGNFYPYLVPGFIAGFSTLILFGFLFAIGGGYIWLPAAGIAIALAIYAQLNARLVQEGYPEIRLHYVVHSWGIGMLTLSSVMLALFTFSEIYGDAAPFLDVMRVGIKDPRYSYIFPLEHQILALVGAFAGAAAILFSGIVLRRIDRNMQPGRAFVLGLLRWFVVAAVVGLIVYVLGAQDALRTSLVQLARLPAEELRTLTRFRIANIVETVSQWSEVYTMLLGISLIALAFSLWQNARHSETNKGMLGSLLIAICLMIGGWLFIGQMPTAAGRGDPEFYSSLVKTMAYAILTVPFELGLGLVLAYLLFHEVKWGKSFYRLVFFMPYIAPTVATATVFAMIFSNRADTGPANQILQGIGLPAQEWLRNPKGIFQIAAEIIGGPETRLPVFLVGPPLPLVAAIIYSIWVYSGYNAVIFMAGLGNVSKDVLEAAQVDGAGRWSTFRHIVFPLISPTTFFLTVLAIIGTLQAFNHIWVLRTNDARGAMDTTTVYIYNTILEASVLKTRPYAAALSFLLFGIILIMTLIQNRMSRDRVFYG